MVKRIVKHTNIEKRFCTKNNKISCQMKHPNSNNYDYDFDLIYLKRTINDLNINNGYDMYKTVDILSSLA